MKHIWLDIFTPLTCYIKLIYNLYLYVYIYTAGLTSVYMCVSKWIRQLLMDIDVCSPAKLSLRFHCGQSPLVNINLNMNSNTYVHTEREGEGVVVGGNINESLSIGLKAKKKKVRYDFVSAACFHS